MTEDPQAPWPSTDSEAYDRREIPAAATAGRRTPDFTAETVPPGLLSKHHTNAWATLMVTEGSVLFTEAESHWTATATPAESVVIVPGRVHHIQPAADAVFCVQFYDLPDHSSD